MKKSNKVAEYYPTISAQETKQTNKQSNPLTLTVFCEKRSCLIRSKKKKLKPKKTNKKTIQKNVVKEK